MKHIGTGNTPYELSQLIILAQKWIDSERIKSGVLSFFDTRYEQSELQKLLTRLTFKQALDTPLFQFLVHFYHKIGFSALPSKLFRDLVIARIVDPVSKRKTQDILQSRFGKQYALTTIYRTLRDCCRLHYQQQIETIIKQFIERHLGIRIAVLFFDVTTLYYEAFDEDDLRQCGWSKEQKHNQPQIVIALIVTTQGIPLALRMFPGNTFEGHTLFPCITEVMEQFILFPKRIVIVADAAMLNQDNLEELEEKQMKYIVGARLGNVSDSLFKKITKVPGKDGANRRIPLVNKRIMVVGYSAQRAKKDKFDREKQIEKANEMLLKPSSVVKRYKFIAAVGKDQYRLNKELIEKAEKLEGLKGYVTNATALTNKAIMKRYNELWQIEKAFRMSKSDLKARPIFHSAKESIEAHLLMVFTALVIARYVELSTHQSIAHIIQILSPVKEVIVEDNLSKQRVSQYTSLTEEARKLAKLAKIPCVT